MKRITALAALLSFICSLCAAETLSDAEPYSAAEFPSFAADVRRTEIITFGSLPFTTMAVTAGYQIFRYANSGFSSALFPNPFAKSSDAANLNTAEQLGILWTALGISCAIGLTDIIISIVKRNKKQNEARRITLPDNVEIGIEPPELPRIRTIEEIEAESPSLPDDHISEENKE
ncbi:MAG: hypothetical protein NC041_04740 [Bacteroides sp.]|nr:hypothetical protein [Prevotella sp.]MCM1407266.1 hypothetical protein [Treponema brennaborense]MCM1469754.1 hypothetical protein [Bacteroides sp.]